MDSQCEVLPWDSAFFELHIGRVTVSRLTEAQMRDVLVWSEAEGIDCLYFLCDSGDSTSVRLAETNAFHFADMRVTLSATLQESAAEWVPVGASIRPWVASDLDDLRAIARVSHTHSRFFFDPHFDPERARKLYETWIERSCEGFSDAVLVAEVERRASGYITCRVVGDQHGEVGLLGVAADQRGRGLGEALVRASLEWFAARGVGKVSVVTQGRNAVAQRLYQRAGFLTGAIDLWYHRWKPERIGEGV